MTVSSLFSGKKDRPTKPLLLMDQSAGTSTEMHHVSLKTIKITMVTFSQSAAMFR